MMISVLNLNTSQTISRSKGNRVRRCFPPLVASQPRRPPFGLRALAVHGGVDAVLHVNLKELHAEEDGDGNNCKNRSSPVHDVDFREPRQQGENAEEEHAHEPSRHVHFDGVSDTMVHVQGQVGAKVEALLEQRVRAAPPERFHKNTVKARYPRVMNSPPVRVTNSLTSGVLISTSAP